MRLVGVLLGLAIFPTIAHADGTAEAAITLQDRTIFLSANNTSSALLMVTREDTALLLTFAQLHLGFPLPPVLSLALREETGVWHLDAVSFDAPTRAIVTAPTAFQISTSEDGLHFTFTGEALHHTPLGVVLRPIEITVAMPAD